MADTLNLLHDLVRTLKCKPGWSFAILTDKETGGPCLIITVEGYNSAFPNEKCPITVSHWFPIPLATYNRQAWRRWIFEYCRGVENHELGEWFRDGDERPFQPLHGPGEMPYVVHEFRPMTDALTTQDGSMREPYKG